MTKRITAALLCLLLCAGGTYAETCAHKNCYDLYMGDMTYPYSSTQHVSYSELSRMCYDCGEYLFTYRSTSPWYSAHEFDSNGVCWCGYKKGAKVSGSVTPGSEPIEVNGEKLTPKRAAMFNPEASVRRASYAGPGDQYESTGGFELYKIAAVYAWLIEGDYVLVDMQYRTVKRCTVYIHRKYFEASSLKDVPEISLKTAGRAKLNKAVTPAMFPAADRRMFNASDAKLEKGATVPVFMERGGYLFCQFTCRDGKEARGWIPADATDWNR